MKKECKKPCRACKCEEKKPNTVGLPITVGLPEIPSYVHISENQGHVEVVFLYRGQSIRLLGDKDGIHIGSMVIVVDDHKPVVKAKAKRVR